MLINSSYLFSQDSILLARTTGKLPFIEYGIGDDRLGGAKMTYLDSNILLKIVDSFKTNYKVQLSKNHSAYISKENVIVFGKQLNKLIISNAHLSSIIKVIGDSAFDYVTVNIDERM